MDFNLVNTIILMVGTLLVPALTFFVKGQIAAALSDFERRVMARLEQITNENNTRHEESQAAKASLDKRLTVVENGYAVITEQLNTLVKELHQGNVQRERKAH